MSIKVIFPRIPGATRRVKDTVKWCRGVKGRAHNKVWVLDYHHNGRWFHHGKQDDWYILACTSCGKEFGHCYEHWLRRNFVCKCGHHQGG